jgi:hypothetical protein
MPTSQIYMTETASRIQKLYLEHAPFVCGYSAEKETNFLIFTLTLRALRV